MVIVASKKKKDQTSESAAQIFEEGRTVPAEDNTPKIPTKPLVDNNGKIIHKAIQVYNEKAVQKPFIENLPPIDTDNEIFVDYDAKKWESKNLFYPYVKVPDKGTKIKYPVKGKNSRKGMVEYSFCEDFLAIFFKELIYDNLTVFTGTSPKEPDIALISLRRNLFIDIEVDEPYDGINRNPIHYVEVETSIDEYRNKAFTDQGWLVIRFSEKQVKEQPLQCCRYIYKIVQSIINISIPELDSVDCLTKEKMWTKDEARAMEKKKDREHYLGISEFYPSNTPRTVYNIKENPKGGKIDDKLKPEGTPVILPQTTKDAIAVILSKMGNEINPRPNDMNPPHEPILHEPKISTQPTNQPSTPAPRPYAV
jgi:hypothetical protein